VGGYDVCSDSCKWACPAGSNRYSLNLIYRETDDQNLYYLHNAHGDVTKLLDEKGDLIKDYEYDPYGREATPETPAFGGDRSTALWRQEVDKIDNPFHYCGEYLDEETGNYYLRARYYSPQTGRFISEDSVEGSITNPLSLNLYTYCGNNPVVNIDPSGHIDQNYTHGYVWNNYGEIIGHTSNPNQASYTDHSQGATDTHGGGAQANTVWYSGPSIIPGIDPLGSWVPNTLTAANSNGSGNGAQTVTQVKPGAQIPAVVSSNRRTNHTNTSSTTINNPALDIINNWQPEPDTSIYPTSWPKIKPQDSNGYITIGIKNPTGIIKKCPILKKLPVGTGLVIDLDDGRPGIVTSFGPAASGSINWTSGEPQSGTDYFAEQYVGVGVTTTLNGSNSIGIGLGGGFGIQQTWMLGD